MCDSMVTVTGDGVLFAKNSDRDPNEAQLLEWVPAADHEDGDLVPCTWIDVPQVAHTHATLVSRPWWMWGAEMGTNEHGVVIGNEAVFTTAEPGDKALLGMDLLRLALERAATADAAVSVMVDLLERHGQGGPCSYERTRFTYDNSFLVADPGGAYVLETSGSRWATEVVTGPGRSISNGLTIPAFARAHSRALRTWVSSAAARRERTEPLARKAAGPGDLMEVLRSHGGSVAPRWSPVHGGLGAPCVHAGGLVASSQTTASWVSDLRGGAGGGSGSRARHWATATSAPCTSLFKPVAVDEPMDLGATPTNVFDPDSLWWRHELLHRSTMAAHSTLIARYRYARDRTESRWIADPPSSVSAFGEAARLERRWLRDVAAADLRDSRPAWVRRAWKAIDRAADIDRPDHLRRELRP
jgi:secernin